MPDVGAQVVQFGTILWRNDKAEMVPVVLAALPECAEVGLVRLRSVGLPWFAVAAGAVALDVAQVLGQRPWAGLALVNQQGLDGHPAREWRERGARKTRCRVPASQPRTGALTGVLSLATGQCWAPHSRLSASLANLLEHLGNEALIATLRRTRAKAKVIIAAVGHDGDLSKQRRSPACEARRKASISTPCTPYTARRRRSRVPHLPHVQTGVATVRVPPPFVLPSAFASRMCSRHRWSVAAV